MTADQDGGVSADSQVYPGDFGVAIGCGIGLIEQCHDLYAILTALEYEGDQFVDSKAIISGSQQCTLKEGVNGDILVSKIPGMLGIGSHAFQPVDQQFAE